MRCVACGNWKVSIPIISELTKTPAAQKILTASILERFEACLLFAHELLKDWCSYKQCGQHATCEPHIAVLLAIFYGRLGACSFEKHFHQTAKTIELQTAYEIEQHQAQKAFHSYASSMSSTMLPPYHFPCPCSTYPMGANATTRPLVSRHIEPVSLKCSFGNWFECMPWGWHHTWEGAQPKRNAKPSMLPCALNLGSLKYLSTDWWSPSCALKPTIPLHIMSDKTKQKTSAKTYCGFDEGCLNSCFQHFAKKHYFKKLFETICQTRPKMSA